MKIEVDYEKEMLFVNDHAISLNVLKALATGPTPGPWFRVISRSEGNGITVENATSALLIEQWIKDAE